MMLHTIITPYVTTTITLPQLYNALYIITLPLTSAASHLLEENLATSRLIMGLLILWIPSTNIRGVRNEISLQAVTLDWIESEGIRSNMNERYVSRYIGRLRLVV